MADSTGASYIGLFDADDDCAISVAEVASNSVIASLLAPDVTVEGEMALSLGFGTSAVRAQFVAP